MSSEDISFLRDQVYRLNAVLAEYQKKYPPIGLTPQLTDGQTPDMPWLSDKNMSPLLVEYDSNLNIMKEQLIKYQSEQHQLHAHVDKLVAENNRLNRELKDSVQNQLSSFAPMTSSDVNAGAGSMVEDQVIQNLQHQLQMALQEKDSAIEMWEASINEVERLERNNKNQQFNPKLQSLEHQANQIKQQYIRTVEELNKEIQALQQELSISKNELKISQNQTTELRKTLMELQKQITLQEHEKNEVVDGKRHLANQSSAARKEAIFTETKLKQAEIELTQLKHENQAMEERMADLQKKCGDFEQKAYEAATQLRDNIQTAESAIIEKDEVQQREKQSQQEIARLQEAMSSLLDQAGSRTRQEVDSVREQCNKNLSTLMEEVHKLEMDNTEKQAQIERVIREKRAAESELEKIYQEGMMTGHKEKSAYDDMNHRACDAERMRDDALVKMDAMENEMKRMEMTINRDKNTLATEVEQLKDRHMAMNQEFELANNDRVKLTEKVDELQRKLIKVQKERDTAQRRYTKEVSCMGTEKKMKEKEYEVRLQSTEDNHRSAMMEIRQMLASQQRMSAKWKGECQAITAKFEKKVQDIREDVKREKQRNVELTNLLKESRDKTMEIEGLLSEYTRNIKRMEERVRESETRAVSAAMQASRSSHREDIDIIAERKRLQRELERGLRETHIHQGNDLLASHSHTTPYGNGAGSLDPEVTAR